MTLSNNLTNEVRLVIDEIQTGVDPKVCVPAAWKLLENRSILDKAFQDVCFNLWMRMGDTALNRTGYSNSILYFWNEVIGKKEKKISSSIVEHCDDSWYF